MVHNEYFAVYTIKIGILRTVLVHLPGVLSCVGTPSGTRTGERRSEKI
jgi:hypothetical protein